ncbi:hypothetical protein H9Y04_15430 [Streptomyces sp. TRM66268-LWL]|uniref:Uncharacterized protein n=1 Tax=Streptomyces polyasparticus TaxID=2767826 RepID=A0ABR7SEW3_9ACTN|nr:hypothetical protein [Streptomyces polyasparticus]MBC9713958.1 hypothetical protein [Streptomyces polyasparticus]
MPRAPDRSARRLAGQVVTLAELLTQRDRRLMGRAGAATALALALAGHRLASRRS